MEKPKLTSPGLWGWVKALSTLMLVGVLTYRIYVTPIQLTVDFPILLSLLLALFSVGLAALFYFKATETSNAFYDNTYTFTKDIAQLLVKIESGFGERLRHLDEGYSSMRDYLQKTPRHSSEVEETKKKIETEEQEISKVLSERQQIIQKLVEHSQLQSEEKEAVLSQLQEKETALKAAQEDLTRMNKQLLMERVRRREFRDSEIKTPFTGFTKHTVIPRIGLDTLLHSSSTAIIRDFERIKGGLPNGYIEDLEERGYFSDGLTREGVRVLRKLAKRIDE